MTKDLGTGKGPDHYPRWKIVATVLYMLRLRVCKFIFKNVRKGSKIFKLIFEVELNNFFSQLFTLKNLLMIIQGFKKHEIFWIYENFWIFV
jgi:hypothetical protein